jgi:dTDP-4-dehydrorhamnose 3,5-epimerase
VRFVDTPLAGAYVVELEPIADARGFFARSFCANEFTTHRLDPRLVQCNVSYNVKRGTLRGMHFQKAPHAEAKLVRCTRGRVYDVIVDLRPDSVTYLRWFGLELSADNRKMLFIPQEFAHGFQTLADDSEMFYQMSEFYHGESASGVRWDDPALAIQWPIADPIVSDKDRSYPLINPGR